MNRRRRRCEGDDGRVAGIEALPFGVLTFVIGALLVANGWAVVDAKVAVSSAAREAARAYVEASDAASADRAARTVGAETIQCSRTERGQTPPGHHPRARPDVGPLRPRGGDGALPGPRSDVALDRGVRRAFDAVTIHSEIVDPYRGGLPGDAQC